MTAADFRDLADRMADTARGIVREGRDRLSVEIKPDGSPVTEIDRAVEHALREILTREVPDHGILGEEYGAEGLDREFVWVLDPIDGTKQFSAGLPNFGVLIALCQDACPALGVIEQPLTGERTLGLAGLGCWGEGRAVWTSGRTRLDESIGVIANPDSFGDDHVPGMERVRRATRWNLFDVGCLSHAALARGRIDVIVDSPNLDPYDICALVPVIEGAGGVMTGWDGMRPTLHATGPLITAASPELHAAALALVIRVIQRN